MARVYVRELIHQGNIRRIIIKNKKGGIMIEMPLTVGLVGGASAAISDTNSHRKVRIPLQFSANGKLKND
ncbi:MAG: DUF4342 domain-containing protein [Oscillatoriaceae bacterium SKW80]|nr:DUF4342 domain-containing protein [Oscillatoriaceae bacterium SKYG93]MCX8121369.1 DUF4342 domain-containing protein [Oscillatoriaceae bacterium SKW80]MDW8451954.1 DUF4342 domain-containing protein [Oscillatoriaceae cyanobacterium SKYGB_i_bin93]